jgi:hypothetical protein
MQDNNTIKEIFPDGTSRIIQPEVTNKVDVIVQSENQHIKNEVIINIIKDISVYFHLQEFLNLADFNWYLDDKKEVTPDVNCSLESRVGKKVENSTFF